MGDTPNVSNSLTIRVQFKNDSGMLGRLASEVGRLGGDIGAVDLVSVGDGLMVRDLTINCRDDEHAAALIAGIRALDDFTLLHSSDRTFLLHLGGKIEVVSRVPIRTRDDLSMVYTPGVARVCMAIHARPEDAYSLTIKKNTVAVVTDGTAVLGLGDIGPAAAMPVMEGKCALFKEFAGVDAFPLAINTTDTDGIVETVSHLATAFGGINLEDISAPRCFYIEDKLREQLDIPVFHDDQHGTAVVVLAGLINALKIVDKRPHDLKVVVAGVGAAGTACTNILNSYGVTNIIGFDRQGALDRTRDYGDNTMKQWYADNTNPDDFSGTLAEGLVGADMLLGLAGPNLVTSDQLRTMNSDAIVFALSNPDPEIWPEEVPDNVRVMATGRSDYPNQVNNSLCFPGLFRGVLDVRASTINDEMKVAAAVAIAGVIPDSHISEDFIIPSVFDQNVARRVSRGVARVAQETGVARRRRRGGDEIYAAFRTRS